MNFFNLIFFHVSICSSKIYFIVIIVLTEKKKENHENILFFIEIEIKPHGLLFSPMLNLFGYKL